MKVNEDLLATANFILNNNQNEMESNCDVVTTIGCWGCGLGCSGTVGG